MSRLYPRPTKSGYLWVSPEIRIFLKFTGYSNVEDKVTGKVETPGLGIREWSHKETN